MDLVWLVRKADYCNEWSHCDLQGEIKGKSLLCWDPCAVTMSAYVRMVRIMSQSQCAMQRKWYFLCKGRESMREMGVLRIIQYL